MVGTLQPFLCLKGLVVHSRCSQVIRNSALPLFTLSGPCGEGGHARSKGRVASLVTAMQTLPTRCAVSTVLGPCGEVGHFGSEG